MLIVIFGKLELNPFRIGTVVLMLEFMVLCPVMAVHQQCLNLRATHPCADKWVFTKCGHCP